MHLQILFLESPVLIMICNLYSNSGFFFYVLSSCGYSVLWCCNFINLKLLRWPWFLKICLFWTMVHPCCYAWASGRGERGLLSELPVRASSYSGFSRRGARGLGHVGSVVAGNQLSQLPEGSLLNLPKLFPLYSHWPKMCLHPGQWYIQFSPWSLWNGTQDNNWFYFRNTHVTVTLFS